MNLDMLFWAAAELNDKEMYEIAVNHARKTQRSHIRQDYSTTHLVVFDPETGDIKSHLTNQGYSDTSSWARGQAWAIAGFSQTFHWTQDVSFLETAEKCADYFLSRLPDNHIPPWDFCAPKDVPQPPDTSAAVIATYGLLLIHQAFLQMGRESNYYERAINILKSVCKLHMNPITGFIASTSGIATVELVQTGSQTEITAEKNDGPETILNGATINNYKFAPRIWADHGLVYADYYFLLIGNKLLEMGAASSLRDFLTI
jgi:hypothetical protein